MLGIIPTLDMKKLRFGEVKLEHFLARKGLRK